MDDLTLNTSSSIHPRNRCRSGCLVEGPRGQEGKGLDSLQEDATQVPKLDRAEHSLKCRAPLLI